MLTSQLLSTLKLKMYRIGFISPQCFHVSLRSIRLAVQIMVITCAIITPSDGQRTSTSTDSEPDSVTQCFKCSNYNGDSPNPNCPMDGNLAFQSVTLIDCGGPCFTMNDASDSRLVIRGCSTSLQPLPAEFPPEGCYDWRGATVCLCYMVYCNTEPLGESSGEKLDPKDTFTIATTTRRTTIKPLTSTPTTNATTTTTTTESPSTSAITGGNTPTRAAATLSGSVTNRPSTVKPATTAEPEYSIECYRCSSHVGGAPNIDCPTSGNLKFDSVQLVGCYGPCYIMGNASKDKPVTRGCAGSLQPSREELPPEGCYDWHGVTICLCYMDYCNVEPLGRSSGEFLQTSEGAECFNCSSSVNGVPNENCPYSEPIGVFEDKIMMPCSGPCFTRNVAGQGGLLIRGCTTDVHGLPETLPSTGCYDWEGATFCTCATDFCNIGPMVHQTSTNAQEQITAAAATTTTTTTTTTIATNTTNGVIPAPSPPTLGSNFLIQCIDCRNYVNNTINEAMCPRNGSVKISMVYSGNCSGPCFTRSDPENSRMVVRGCTATQGTLPTRLPGKGCYDWNGVTVCVCYTSNCNHVPLGDSSGISLDVYASDIETDPGIMGGPLQCYECMNYNVDGKLVPQCPKDSRVNSQIVYRGNCTGACFTRTFNDNSTKVGRGCTSSQYGVPYPLPPAGCYSWNHETWCICNTTNCNGVAIGVSNGIEMDAHLYNFGEDFVEPDGVKKCYQCLSYFNDVYYPQCPKNGRVKNAYFAPCNGTCFTRNYDNDDRIVARGCSDYQYGLPNPLPPDGCYTWYTEIWCVCSTSRCNGAALGKPQNIEFDAHIHKPNGGDQSVKITSYLYIFSYLALACLFK